jgi:DNA polymerase I-like protein with 3'-5' exonuclease and polymerase domains
VYLRHKDLKSYWVLDIETDDLAATVVWCVVLQNVATRQIIKFHGDFYSEFRRWVAEHPEAIFVGHNLLSFDVPTLNRLCGTDIPLDRLVDTLVLSYLYDPVMQGGHSLEAWGERFKFPKGDFNDWSHFSDKMLSYCVRDVELTCLLFTRLTARMAARGFSEKSCQLEHQIRHVVNKQEKNGFWFNVPKAEQLYAELRQRERDYGDQIHRLFPPELKLQETYRYRVKRDGSPYSTFLRHTEQYEKVVRRGDEYDVYSYEEFNIGSPMQRVEKLLSLGWKPSKFTPKGNPQVDEESLVAFANEIGSAEVRAIADWLVVNGRANMINTWLNNVRPDSRIHGKVMTCGAGTRRMTHSAPNTANIPGNEAKYGHECRECWGATPGRRRLVGYDAKALEMRMFGHYLNDPVAAELYINGDPHSVNAAALGHERKPAKTDFYAFMYGASDGKLALPHGKGREYGRWMRETLMSSTPGLEDLIKEVQAEQKAGFILCIDGGFVRCPSPHAALNYKLQSAGAITMKQAAIFIDQRVQERGLDCLKVGDIHDEGQHDCAEGDAEEFGKLAVQAIRDAGEELNFSVPLDGDYKVGGTWAETH